MVFVRADPPLPPVIEHMAKHFQPRAVSLKPDDGLIVAEYLVQH
jgi:hypothetical protein